MQRRRAFNIVSVDVQNCFDTVWPWVSIVTAVAAQERGHTGTEWQKERVVTKRNGPAHCRCARSGTWNNTPCVLYACETRSEDGSVVENR